MKKRSHPLTPKKQALLEQLGEQIKIARLRRHYSESLVAQRAGISRSTLQQIEAGSEKVSMGRYLSVLHALGLQRDILRIAEDDEFGRKLQDAEIITKRKAPKRRGE